MSTWDDWESRLLSDESDADEYERAADFESLCATEPDGT